MLSILKRKSRPRLHTWDLSEPLIYWDNKSPWNISDACMGTAIWGSSGSGKTTGSLAAICRALLKNGWGGLFLTSKREDRAIYERYVRESGREDSLLVFSPDNRLHFNFIDAEMRRSSNAVGLVENLTALLMTVTELGESSRSGSRENEQYFQKAAARLARNAILVLMLAHGCLTISELHRFITSLPTSIEEVRAESERKQAYWYQCMVAAERAPKSESMRADFAIAASFVFNEWPSLHSRTRTAVESTLTVATDMLSRGAARDLLSSPTTNVTPEMCYDGAIVIADFPVLLYHDVGQLIQVILKYCWQRAHSARDVSRNPRPTFIVCDESHLLAVNSDQAFQTTARSSKTAVIYATQSISNYLEVFGEGSEPRVHSLLGNLQTQIFHQQTDTRTIAYAQELIGRRRQLLLNGNSSDNGDWIASLSPWGNQQPSSAGFSESYEFDLQAADFNGLAKGGPPRWEVEAILYQGGKRFNSTDRTWMPVTFRQQ